jgi:hypothetical protein
MYRYEVTTDCGGFLFMATDKWQTALDTWSETLVAVPHAEMRIEVFKDDIKVQTLRDIAEIKKHSDYLMFLESDKENRVTKRLVQQEYDGMEIVEPQESYDDFIRRAVKAADDIAEEEYELLSELSDDIQEHLTEIDFHGDFENMSWEQQDDIINPKHYKMIPKEAYEKHPEGLEYMDLMDYILAHHNGVESHLLGQVFKYAMRLGKKDADLQDARKIEWYASRLVDTIQERS